MSEEHRVKHLEFIQGVINRLSTNSFLLKGWTVVLVAALLSFAVSEDNAGLGLFTIIPLLVFWGLDGYFLWEERKYRKHYNRVRLKAINEIDFCMNVADLTPEVGRWLKATFSKTLVAFHGILLLSIIAAVTYEIGGFSWLRGYFSASITQTTTGEQAK
ncbi:hypothetical protein [Vannielia sp. SX4]|uniref:hypothetical protein n=1 Tax=Vannielia sp. SX4 TaxID=3463852 RepID=UPI0040595E9D